MRVPLALNLSLTSCSSSWSRRLGSCSLWPSSLSTSLVKAGGRAGLSLVCIRGPPFLVNHFPVQVPRIVHHQGEILVIINRGRDIIVVLLEFVLGHDVVWSLVVPYVVLSLESFQKFHILMFIIIANIQL